MDKKKGQSQGKAATIMCLMHKSKTHLKLNHSIQQITKQSRTEKKKHCDMKAIISIFFFIFLSYKGLCVGCTCI